jgi:hypothetical protein
MSNTGKPKPVEDISLRQGPVMYATGFYKCIRTLGKLYPAGASIELIVCREKRR